MKFRIVTTYGIQEIPFIEKITYKGRVLVIHRAFTRGELCVFLHSVSDLKTGYMIADGTKETVFAKAIEAIDSQFGNQYEFDNYFISNGIDETINSQNQEL